MLLKNNKGVILISAYLIIVILLILGGAFIFRSISEKRIADRSRDTARALYLAEAGIDKAASELWTVFDTAYPNPTLNDFSWFNSLLVLDPAPNPPYTPPTNVSLGGGTYSVQIVSVVTPTGVEGRDVTIRSYSTVSDSSRSVEAVIRYTLAPFGVFNYSYFINNFGWFYGGGITSNGDVRSNGNFAFQGNPLVNGDIYAATNPDLGAAGTITGSSRNQTISQYQSGSGSRGRPTNPTDPSNPGGTIFEPGYDGASNRFPQQQVLEMPYLGDLTTYEALAISEGGTIRQGATTLVNGVYGDDSSEKGPDGISGTADDGCIVLIGTDANPIVIDGPVVVTKDVIIKGKVQGQGTIYTGRNTHIVGDITYKNPPSWPKPDPNPNQTNQTNASKDFLGLLSKGNFIIGDYTRNDWQTTVLPYLKPPFTQPYKVGVADQDIGYVQYWQGSDPYFSGDYTTNDGGTKIGSSSRKFYESSLSNSYIQSISAPSNQIRQIDAITYTNHALAGRVGAFAINGSIISRDEATVYSGSIKMNYDVRAYGSGAQAIDIFLPRELAAAQTISWKESN